MTQIKAAQKGGFDFLGKVVDLSTTVRKLLTGCAKVVVFS